jgi:hypothetical protein
MEGRTEIYNVLSVDTNVTDKIGTYSSKPAIFTSPVVPASYKKNAISMYLTVPTNGGLEYGNYSNTVNNFAKSYNEAEDMQKAVYDSLNRASEGSDTFFLCAKQIVISPSDTGGDYNAPVEVLVRQR